MMRSAMLLLTLIVGGAAAKDLPPLQLGSGPGPSSGPAPASVPLPGPREPYVAPKPANGVVELFDEKPDPLIPELTNDSGAQQGEAFREERDVFSGLHAMRVTQCQKYRATIPGWSFKIVETPQKPNEFRYLRFAWKKLGGSGIMVQLHDDPQTWSVRYVAGPNTVGWGSKSLADLAPKQWEVVTRDLFQDFGPLTITGIALTPMDGDGGLFDHILLGRTLADLDAATDRALGRTKLAKAPTEAERVALVKDLTHKDPTRAAEALRTLLATAPENVRLLRASFEKPLPPETWRTIEKLITDLDDDRFDVRENASRELAKHGEVVHPLLVDVTKTGSPEAQFRAERILTATSTPAGQTTERQLRSARFVRILVRADTTESKDLLQAMQRGDFGPDFAHDAQAAAKRSTPIRRTPAATK